MPIGQGNSPQEVSPFGSDKPNKIIMPRYNEDDGKWYDENEKRLSVKQWGLQALNEYKAVSITEKTLPSGSYQISVDNRDGRPVFILKELIHDNLIELKGLPKEIADEIEDFWGKEKDFTSLGFLHRRGYLLYGSQGTGKSSLVHQIINEIIKRDGIVFYCDNPSLFNEGLSLFRKIEPRRKIVCVFEDIDAIIKKYDESIILSILDGENQVSGVCNIATTNYPELLDKRIVGRPRRFDRVYKISNLDKHARKAFLGKKLPKGQKIDEWVEKTDGLSIASISEVIISVFCFGKKIEDAVEIVKTLTKDKSSNEYREGKELGFKEE